MTETARNIVMMRQAKIEASKPPVFKRVRDTQEVEYFLWHLENFSRHGNVRGDDAKINIVVLYMSEIVMLWWGRKSTDAKIGLCTINTWDEFKVKFKRQFFLNNVVYNARRKLRELKHTRSILDYVDYVDYVREFMTLRGRLV